ncbi:hypothetical protein GUITHDRAFT_137976 [Guillardia theta CCMP2712]|uniref:GAF domain-containing protein n=1 Tax=Guillardia theta (strain CCMP2712) TaxID=905079 RepID=L1JFC1_GUITC|nr:hypothetical protein GUITHDRAFT_137976 [Guillardia theta CCMP2712]EKX47017.1 hypothetical protein GUITHDRAFT_137976 [Guillardia theta CCMP2712]|eukprot:XP_005833997.1 hypothetical protein GUITHDRAFT_137976 [Guillardia theta CCMP2712]
MEAVRAQQNEGLGTKRGTASSGKDWLKNQRERQKQLLATIDALLPAQAKTKQVKGVGSRSCGSSGRSMFTILQDTISLIRDLRDKGQALHPTQVKLLHQPATSAISWKEALLASRTCMIFETHIPSLTVRNMSLAAKHFCGSMAAERDVSLYNIVAKDEIDTLRFFIEQALAGVSSLSKLLRVRRLDNVHVKQEGATGGSGFDFLEFRILWIAQGQISPASVLVEALHPHSACHPLKPNVRKDRKSLAFRLDRLVPSEFKSQQAKGVGSRAYGDQGRSLLTILQDSIVLMSSVSSAFVSVRGSRCSICEVSRGAAGLFDQQVSQLIGLSLVDLVRSQDRSTFFAFVGSEGVGSQTSNLDATLVLEVNREEQAPTLIADNLDLGPFARTFSPVSPQTSQAVVLSSISRPIQASLHLELPDVGQRPEAASLRLSQTIMRGVWEAGYSVTGLAKMFNELPASVRSVLDKGLWSMEQIFRHNARNQQALVRRTEPPGESMKLIKSLLMKDENIGFWNMEINTETLRRTKLEISPGIANLLNMHPDEMLARVGNKDTELPNSDLEFFCTIICNSSPFQLPPLPPLLLLLRCLSALTGLSDDIISLHQDRLTRYSRLLRRCPRVKRKGRRRRSDGMRQTGKLIDPFLVRVHSIKERNEEGRIFRMWHILERVTPDEYDEARRKNPQICRPMLEQMGDCRGAEDLLESANYDNLFNQSFQFMKTTPEGQQQLQALANAVKECFAPFVSEADRIAGSTGQVWRDMAGEGGEDVVRGGKGRWSLALKVSDALENIHRAKDHEELFHAAQAASLSLLQATATILYLCEGRVTRRLDGRRSQTLQEPPRSGIVGRTFLSLKMQTRSKQEEAQGRRKQKGKEEGEEGEEGEEDGLLEPGGSISSILTIPCVHEGRVMGVMAALNSIQGSFSRSSCEEAATRIARSVSLRLRDLEQVEEVRLALRQQQRVWELAVKLAEVEEEREVAQLVSLRTPKLVGCEAAMLVLVEERGREEETILRNLSGGDKLKKKFTARGMFLTCLSSNKTVKVSCSSLIGREARNGLLVPLTHQDEEAIGLIVFLNKAKPSPPASYLLLLVILASPDGQRLSESDAKTGEQVASSVSTTIRNIKRRRKANSDLLRHMYPSSLPPSSFMTSSSPALPQAQDVGERVPIVAGRAGGIHADGMLLLLLLLLLNSPIRTASSPSAALSSSSLILHTLNLSQSAILSFTLSSGDPLSICDAQGDYLLSMFDCPPASPVLTYPVKDAMMVRWERLQEAACVNLHARSFPLMEGEGGSMYSMSSKNKSLIEFLEKIDKFCRDVLRCHSCTVCLRDCESWGMLVLSRSSTGYHLAPVQMTGIAGAAMQEGREVFVESITTEHPQYDEGSLAFIRQRLSFKP